MKKHINSIKRLCLTISSSTVLNWLVFFMGIGGMLLDIFSPMFYKVMFCILTFELLFVNVNSDYSIRREPTIEELEDAIRKIREANPEIEAEIEKRKSANKGGNDADTH